MSQEVPPHFRPIFNPREPPGHRVDRLRALHAELSTPHGLLQAFAWLPPAWPHLLQLLAAPQPEVRLATALLIGQLGAVMAAGRDLRLAGRMPSTALLDWALALLPPSSTLPAAQKMTAETKEAALTALHTCVAAMPPPAVAPFAKPLLRLSTALLEATTTPPCLLDPLLRLLVAVLPAVPLAELGQGFGDLADLLSGWALDPHVAPQDRQLITVVLHALRPQWHSHPDLTTSLTENMLHDVQAAATAAATAAASAAATGPAASTNGTGAEAAAQVSSCMNLVQLLCDILSAASLRPLLPLVQRLQAEAASSLPVPPAPLPAQGQPPHHPQLPGQQPAPSILQQPQLLPHHYPPRGAVTMPQQPGLLPGSVAGGARPAGPAITPRLPLLALTAMLPTRPSAGTVRHIATLYPQLLLALKEIRNVAVLLQGRVPEQGAWGHSVAAGRGSWVGRLCQCVEALADSVASCAGGLDPRDAEEVLEDMPVALASQLSALTLAEGGGKDRQSGTGHRADLGPSALDDRNNRPRCTLHSFDQGGEEGAGAIGVVGAALSTAGSGAVSLSLAGQAPVLQGPGERALGNQPARLSVGVAPGTAGALGAWALQQALKWALSLLHGLPAGVEGKTAPTSTPRACVAVADGPGVDVALLVGCVARLLRLASQYGHDGCRELLGQIVIGKEGDLGIRSLRSSPRAAAVAAAAKLLHALLSDAGAPVAADTLTWLLADLRACLIQSTVDSAELSTTNVSAATFTCAVLQAACQRGLVPPAGVFRVEAVMWELLQAAILPAGLRRAFTVAAQQVASGLAAGCRRVGREEGPAEAQVPAPSCAGSAAPVATGQGLPMAAAAEATAATAGNLTSAAVAPSLETAQALTLGLPPLPPSATSALCAAWSAAAVALLAASFKAKHKHPEVNVAPSGPAAATHGSASATGREERLLGEPSPFAASAAVTMQRGCGAYLQALLLLQVNATFTFNVRLLAALRLLLACPEVVACGCLRSEPLYLMSADVLATGMGSADAGVRAAATDCGAALVAHVLQGSGGAGGGIGGVTGGPEPMWRSLRPELLATLVGPALEGLNDTSPEVSAAAARLMAEISEAALLAALRGPSSSACGTWLPAWQDELAAVAPQRRAPRLQQVSRLLELVFQSSAAQGSVLLRKRNPVTGISDEAEAGMRLEALQRLALGLPPAAGVSSGEEEGAAASGGGNAAAAGTASRGGDGGQGISVGLATAACNGQPVVANSGAALVWLLLQEGAKQLVATKLRTQLGGPTQTLGALERMLQVTFSRLAQERRDAGTPGVAATSRESAWLALELVGALERAIMHAAEGYGGRDTLPQPVLAFFAANKRVCEEWFTRSREMLARIASLASAHHHAAHHGLLRLRDLRSTMRQLLNNLARERRAAAAAAGTPSVDDKTEGASAGAGTDGTAQRTATGSSAAASTATLEAGPQGAQAVPIQGRQQGGVKQLQRRLAGGAGGPGPGPQQAAPTVLSGQPAAPGGDTAGRTATSLGTSSTGPGQQAPPSAVQQLEDNLARLALAVVDLLKLVGAALLAAGESESLQGLHTWATREFEPLLLGAHLPGASAVSAAAAADALSSDRHGEGLGATAGASAKRRSDALRSMRSNSKQHKDAFSWLLGMSLQAAGSYEQALLSYNAFLAPSSASPISPSLGPHPAVALELAAAAQAFVVERVGECYAVLADWSGLQGLMGAFSRTAAAEPAVGAWWPATAASLEYRFRGLASFDTASPTPFGTLSSDTPDTDPAAGSANSILLASLQLLDAASPGAAARPPRGAVQVPRELRPVRRQTEQELGRITDRLRASLLAEPLSQRELLLQVCCLRSALRGLHSLTAAAGATAGASAGAGAAAAAAAVAVPAVTRICDGPWSVLLGSPHKTQHLSIGGPVGTFASWDEGGLGRELLSPDGALQPGFLRDVAITGALMRTARAADPRVAQPGTLALSLEHIRGAVACANWGLATRLVQAAATRAPAVTDLDDAVVGPGALVRGAGTQAVWSVVHSLLSAAAGRLLPGQVVDLQLRALLPHVVQQRGPSAAPPSPPHSPADADDLACALCTLARWMLKAGAVQHPQQQLHHQPRSPHGAPLDGRNATPAHAGQQPPVPHVAALHPLHLARQMMVPGSANTMTTPPPGFPRVPTHPGPPPSVPALPWAGAADWPALSFQLLSELAAQHHAAGTPSPSSPDTAAVGVSAVAQSAFILPMVLLQSWHAPAVCCLRAVQLSRGSARAWRAWGDLVYRATRDHRARAARAVFTATSTAPTADGFPPTPQSDERGASTGYGAAAAAYCRYLTLSYSHEAAARPEDVLPVLLQVLHIIVRHGGPLEGLLAVQLASVPPLTWAAVTPQLLAQLPGASGAARRLLAALLHAVGRAAPSLVLYPAVVEVRAADAAAAAAAGGTEVAADVADEGGGKPVEVKSSMVSELRALLADLGRARPGLLAGVNVLVGEMERLTVLWDERWAVLLAEVEVEIARRAVSLQAEAARVADDASLTSEQRQALLASRYSTLMAPAVMLLERQLRATAALPPETPHERRFASSVLSRLRAAAAALRDGTGVRDWGKPQQAWAALRAAAAALSRQQRQPLPPMADLSPRLAALVDSEVPMPGCQGDVACGSGFSASAGSGAFLPPLAAVGGVGAVEPLGSTTTSAAVTVAGVADAVVALSTKTRPKRMALLGSDGRTYAYLLKGREDLRMDERLMQVLRTINSMLQADPLAGARDLAAVRHYSVTPLGPRAGLIQWVPSTTSLFAVFRQWQTASLERHAAMVAARQEGVAKAAAEGTPLPPEVGPAPAAATSRPMDLFYATLVPALQDRGLSTATPRRNWPAVLLRSVLATLTASAPQHLLARVLWAGGGSAALSWRRQQRYARSLGVMSCVGHLLGLGDRHPDNILLEGREALVVHIDYNVCWDKGSKLRVPEVVPFRLTPMLTTALGVGGLDGTYRAACEATLACLRRRREAMVGLVDAVLSDPGVDWAVEREDMAARQDMELAVALNLFVSRAEETQRQLQRLEEELPAVVEGPAAALLSYIESHVFAEALKNAATEAQQRIQQSKSALEAASRMEAEAQAIVTAAAQEAASLAAEANSLSAAVPQLLQQCGAWAQQHTCTLGVLRDGSFLEGTAASGASWLLNDSGCALGLLSPVSRPGPASLNAAVPLALLPAVMGADGSSIGRLPEELLLACQEYDRQAADVLGRREAALSDAVAALTQYGTIVRKLLPSRYPGFSYHHRWAQALAALAAGGLCLPAVAQAQALAPREPRPLDIAVAWQCLRGALRLGTAAAVVLAPGLPEAAVELLGHVGGSRVPGREMAGAITAACKALAEAQGLAVADARARQAIAVVSEGKGPSVGALTRDLAALLQRSSAEPAAQWGGAASSAPSLGRGGATVVAVVAALVRLVQSVDGRVQNLAARWRAAALAGHLGSGGPPTPPAVAEAAAAGARIADYVRLGSEVSGLAAVAAAVAEARLAGAVFGSVFALPPVLGGEYKDGADCTGDGVTAAAVCPLPWLAASVEAFARWPELQQRLMADVAPELAGQLHVSAGGSSGGAGHGTAMPETPFGQATADFYQLLRPVEAALDAARDWHRRQGALAVAAELQAAAQGICDALAEALRQLYASVRGADGLPAELYEYDRPAASYAASAAAAAKGGDMGWAEVGGAGHPAVGALLAWWDAVTESLGGLRRSEEQPAALERRGTTAQVWELPPAARPLWRCVEAVRLAGESLQGCQLLRLTTPPGTDGALAEALGTGVPLLASQAAAHATERQLQHLQPQLHRLVGYLVAAEDSLRQQQREGKVDQQLLEEQQRLESSGEPSGSNADVVRWEGAPELVLVPFTDFDPHVAGAGELLGGLEDRGASGGSAGWGAALNDDDGGLGDDGERVGEGSDGYDLDLGLELDLDDGFGGMGDVEVEGDAERSLTATPAADGNGEEAAERGRQEADKGSMAAPRPPPGSIPASGLTVTQGQITAAVDRLAAVAAVSAAADAAAAVDPAAVTAAERLPAASWAAGLEARALRAARLQRLAAFEWLHEHHLLQALPAGDPRVGQALTQFFAAQAADPLQPSSRVTTPSRLALLTQLQAALDSLPAVEQAVSEWEAGSGGVVAQTVALLRGAPEQFPVDTALAAQRAGMLMTRRQQWLAESRAVVMRVCQVSEALLQFEYSRQGITWASGGTAVADGFASHAQLLGRAEVLATLAASGSEAGRAAAVAEASQRAAEGSQQAADARYALELAQYEDVAASSQLQAHLPVLVSRSLDLAPAVAEMEPVVRALVQLLAGKLGPALKELSAVAAQHAAANDVASVAAAVTSHFERSRQAAEALAAALPTTLAGIAAADAASPLPADMATEVGFLSAQLLGGAAAAVATSERSIALLQHMAALIVALQPVMHVVVELPRALAQLDSELSSLAAAASSIAAAVESKHVLPALDEQLPPAQTPQSQNPQTTLASTAMTTPSAAGSDGSATATGPSPLASCGGPPQATESEIGAGDAVSGQPAPLVNANDGGSSSSASLPRPTRTDSTSALTSGAGPLSAPQGTSITGKALSARPMNAAAVASAAAPDHVQHHQSRRSEADEARRRAFAAGALRRFVGKLEGRETERPGAPGCSGGAPPAAVQVPAVLSVPEQVDLLIRQATSADRLAQMYEGWSAWL